MGPSMPRLFLVSTDPFQKGSCEVGINNLGKQQHHPSWSATAMQNQKDLTQEWTAPRLFVPKCSKELIFPALRYISGYSIV